MKSFRNLNEQQQQALLKFPAYISMLAAWANDKLDKKERYAAIKLSHIATFACNPLLAEFYKEADKVFEKNIEQLDKDLPKEKESREAAIKKELLNLEKVLSKLGNEYASAIHHSMKIFNEHVSKAHHSVVSDFILPIQIDGLTD